MIQNLARPAVTGRRVAQSSLYLDNDTGYFNITGNPNGPAFMADPKIITLK
jgi:hypothetical protein